MSMTTNFEKTIIDLYNKKQLTENLLRKLLGELEGYYIDPEAIAGIETDDGKQFKELICFTVEPMTHKEIMNTSRLIDNDAGDIWGNKVEAERMFERIWYDDLDMPDSDESAYQRHCENSRIGCLS